MLMGIGVNRFELSAMYARIGLPIAGEVVAARWHPPQHRGLENRGADLLSVPRNRAWTADLNGKNAHNSAHLQNGGAAGGNLQALHYGFTPCQFHEILLRFFRLALITKIKQVLDFAAKR